VIFSDAKGKSKVKKRGTTHMAFEKYTGARRTSRGAMVTIRQTGQIAFNGAAASDMGLSEVPAVTLHYDKSSKVIGVRAEDNPKADGARKLGKAGRTRTIAASAFMKFFGISLKKNLKVIPVIDKKNDVIALDLKSAQRSPGRPRKNTPKES